MQRYILALAIVIAWFVTADASSLYGKVIEVNSGDVITIFNLNRPVRVKLMGVDAPEMNQEFGDVAKKHLSDLVFEKFVIVEYAGIAADSSLTGRVLLNDADIGAQMIRDGAAWFDPGNGNRLSATDREVYQQSEQAARSEKRGLWQAENPVAPWEFVKAEKMRRNPAASLKEVAETTPRRSGPVPELTNLTLMTKSTNAVPARPSPLDTDSTWARSTARKNWTRMEPPGEDFSAFVPENGMLSTRTTPIAGQIVESHTYQARDGWNFYALVWFKLPTFGEPDQLVIEEYVKQFLTGVAEGSQDGNGRAQFSCELGQQKKSISLNGYTGVEYDLSSICTVPVRVRVYTKVVDDQRQVYFGAVLYPEEEESVTRFWKSFTISSPKTRTR